ncbi:MAG: ABC transporter ATP-binding protein [Candidatus Brocadiia bacterium]
MLKVKNLRVNLGEFNLRDISFEVPDGAYFVLLGASGAGKTILLETMAGMYSSAGGSVWLDDRDITDAPIQKRGLALVYQNQNLFPHLTVRRNIAYGLKCRRTDHRDRTERVGRLADQVGVSDLLERRPGQISGGEAQRVALARALAIEPRCLLLDEPLSSLDTPARRELRRLLRRINRDGVTVMHVTHDYEEALSLASRVAVMEDGRIAHTGRPKDVLQDPESEFVARFVGMRNFFEGELRRPESGEPGVALFEVNGLTCTVLTDADPGPGFLIIQSEDVTLSREEPGGSTRNRFRGEIGDVVRGRLGWEIVLEIGEVEITARITEESRSRLELEPGTVAWASFKASAVRYLPS